MAIVIRRVRVSFFWSAAYGDLLADTPPASAPLAALGHVDTYAKGFDSLVAAPTAPWKPSEDAPSLELPWPAKGTHRFWMRYLDRSSIAAVTGQRAFFRLIPLRRHAAYARYGLELPAKLMTDSNLQVEKPITEAWFHPHMASFGMHLTLNGTMTPAQFAQTCSATRDERVFHALADPAKKLKLDEIGATQLERNCREALGAAAPPLGVADPYSLVTVLQGDTQGEGVTAGGEVHKALERVTHWTPDPPTALEPYTVSTRGDPASGGALVYGRKRSRAVWHPAFFQEAGRVSLSCYHRNLFVGTLQAEALLAFAEFANGAVRPKVVRDCEDAVIRRIVALYGEHRGKTYTSMSLRRFIDEHPSRSAVNAVARRLGVPPLA